MEEKLYSTAEVINKYNCHEFIVVDENDKKHIDRDLNKLITIVESVYVRSIKEIYAAKWSTINAATAHDMLRYAHVTRTHLIEIPDFCIKFKATGVRCNIDEIEWLRIYSVRQGPYETNENEILNFK